MYLLRIYFFSETRFRKSLKWRGALKKMTFNILVYGSVCFHVIALTKNVKAITFLLFVDDSSSCTLLNSAAYRWLEKGRKNLDFFKFEYFCSINIICLCNFIFVWANPKLSKQMLIFSGQYINRQNKSLLMVC